MNHPFLRLPVFTLLIAMLLGALNAVAQTDTPATKEDLQFDLGLIRDRNHHLWPLLYKHKTSDYKDVQLLFTVYRKLERFDKGQKHLHLMPLFWYDSSAAGKDLRVGTLYYPNLFRYVKDTATQSKSVRFLELAPEINMLNITRSANGLYTQNNLFFFIWSKNDQVAHKTQFTVFPLYWYNRDTLHTTSALVPVYRYKREDKETHFDLYPALYFYKGDERRSRHYLFPFIYHSSYAQNSARRAHKTVVFPLVFHHRNEKSLRFTLFPIFHVNKRYVPRTSLEYKRTVMVTPLYWQRDYQSEGNRILFPVYWRYYDFSTQDSQRSTLLFPLYYSKYAGPTARQVLFPVYWHKRNTTDTNVFVLPVYARLRNEDRAMQLVFPLYLNYDDYLGRLNRRAYTPLYWHTRSPFKQTHLLFPVYYSRHDTAGDQRHVLPLFYSGRNAYSRWHTLLPVYLRYHNTDSVAFTAITPLYWNWKNTEERSTLLLPLYYSYRDSASAYRHVFPLFYSGREQRDRWHTLVPVYYRQRFAGDTMWLSLPGYYSRKTATLNKHVWFPLVWMSDRDTGIFRTNTRLVVPFYLRYKVGQFFTLTAVTPLFWNRYKLNPTIGEIRNYSLLFPLWWSKERVLPGNVLRTQVLFPLYFAKNENSYQHRVLFPLYWRYQNADYRSSTFVPFYFQYRTLNGAYHLQAYTPLLWRLRTTQKQSFSVLPFWFSNTHYSNGDSVRARVLFPLYWSYRGNHHRSSVVFPLYWKFKTDSSRSVTLLPFMHASTQQVEGAPEKYLMVFPLYYAHRHKDERNVTLLPLYYHHREGADSTAQQHTLLLPVYYHRRLAGDTVKLFAPLVYLFRNEQFRMSVYVPFYLNHRTADSRLQAITPLYWHYRDEEMRRKVLFPFWWSYHDTDLTRRMLFPLWLSEQQRNGGYTKGVTPLFWHYGDKQVSKYLLFPVWWSRTSNSERARLLLPLFYYDQHRYNGDYHLWALPTFWRSHEGHQTNTSLFPLWFKRVNTGPDAYRSSFVPVLYYRYRSDSTQHLNVLVLFHHTHRPTGNTSFLVPFYLYHREAQGNRVNSLTAITPLYWRNYRQTSSNSSTLRTVTFPLYYTKRHMEQDTVALQKRVLFPLWWYSKDRYHTFNLIAPVYMRHRMPLANSSLTVITPFLWIKREGQDTMRNRHVHVLGLFNHHLSIYGNDVTRRYSLFPLFFSKHRTIGNNVYTSRVVFPVFWYGITPKRSTTVFLPLYLSHTRFDRERRVRAYTPLVWYIHDDKHDQLVAWPLFNYRHEAGSTRFNLAYLLYRYDYTNGVQSNSVLWPLVQHIKGPEYRYFHLAPLWWYKRSPSMSYTSLQPFFYIQQTPEYRRTHVLWQVYSRKKVFGQRTGTSVLWYAYYNNRFENGDKETRLLYLLYANVKKEGNTEKALLPFYHHTTSANGEYSRSYLFGLYQQTKTLIPNTSEFYVEEKVLWYIRLRSNFEALKRRGIITNRKFKTGG